MWARDEFRKLVVGKTKEEVINSLGNPDRISGDGLRWTYRGRTYDPTATSNDISTTVRFGRETGKVIRVDF
jgi:outer membrane protein assembly factor BamE (lipoprotein component of BamABCDE complex)